MASGRRSLNCFWRSLFVSFHKLILKVIKTILQLQPAEPVIKGQKREKYKQEDVTGAKAPSSSMRQRKKLLMIAGHGDEFSTPGYAANGSGTTPFNTRPKRTLYVDHRHQILLIINHDESECHNSETCSCPGLPFFTLTKLNLTIERNDSLFSSQKSSMVECKSPGVKVYGS